MSYYQGDYYMAGGFFSKLKKLGRFVGKTVKPIVKPLVGMAATAVNPTLGLIVGGAQTVGRTQTLLSPAAAPAGMPSEGAPPLAPVAQQTTYGGMDPAFLQLLMLLLLRRR